MNKPIIISAKEKSLSFNGYSGDAIALANSLREAYSYTDMPKMLNDFVFGIEVALQNAGVLDEWFEEVKT